MTDKELYEAVVKYSKLNYKDTNGISFEKAIEVCPPGWLEPLKKLYKIAPMLNFPITRIFMEKSKLYFNTVYDDPDMRRMLYYLQKYMRVYSRNICVITGNHGLPQYYIDNAPCLSWELAARTANFHYEVNGYDELYTPVGLRTEASDKYNIRGRYRSGSPARRFYLRPDGSDDISNSGKSD